MKAEVFTPYVLEKVAGVPDVVIERAVMDTVILFCEESRVWDGRDEFDADEGESDYVVSIPQNTKISFLNSVHYDGEILAVADSLPVEVKEGHPREYIYDDGLLMFDRAPGADDLAKIVVKFSLKPLRDSFEFDDVIFEDWKDPIVSGAVSRLLMQKRQPWGDPRLASVFKGEYDVGASKAKIRGINKRSGSSHGVRHQRLGRAQRRYR